MAVRAGLSANPNWPASEDLPICRCPPCAQSLTPVTATGRRTRYRIQCTGVDLALVRARLGHGPPRRRGALGVLHGTRAWLEPERAPPVSHSPGVRHARQGPTPGTRPRAPSRSWAFLSLPSARCLSAPRWASAMRVRDRPPGLARAPPSRSWALFTVAAQGPKASNSGPLSAELAWRTSRGRRSEGPGVTTHARDPDFGVTEPMRPGPGVGTTR